MIANIPARAIARWVPPPAASSGKRAAKIKGEIDESGPEDQDLGRTEDGVADEAPDRGVQAGHGWEPGQLRVGHPGGTKMAARTTPATRSERVQRRS